MIRFMIEQNVYHCSHILTIFRSRFNEVDTVSTAFGKYTKSNIVFSGTKSEGVWLYHTAVVYSFFLDAVMYDEVNRWKLIRIK